MLNRLSIEVLNASTKTINKIRKSLRATHNHKIVVDFNTLLPIGDKDAFTEDQLSIRQKETWGSYGNAEDAKFIYPNIFQFTVKENVPTLLIYALGEKFNNHTFFVKLATEDPNFGTKSLRLVSRQISGSASYRGLESEQMWNFCWQGVKEPLLVLTTQDDAWAGFTKWGC